MSPLAAENAQADACSLYSPPCFDSLQTKAPQSSQETPIRTEDFPVAISSSDEENISSSTKLAKSQAKALLPKIKNKSVRRKAAEALLERKASKQKLDPMSDQSNSSLVRSFVIPACDKACAIDCDDIDGHATSSFTSSTWCSIEVTMPSLNWPAILTAVSSNPEFRKKDPLEAAADGPLSPTTLNPDPKHIALPGGLVVYVVDTLKDLPNAIQLLRDSMQDRIVAIDLEWKPDFALRSNNKVALMQLATGTHCVLIRCRQLQYTLPDSLISFFRDPSITFVSFSWDCADQKKMQLTFGHGKSLFANFIDLQKVSNGLGYPGIGLSALTTRVLGVTMPKSGRVSRSNWEKKSLSVCQVTYAALDAFVTGYVFRGLRLWHSSPSPCTGCKKPFGVEVPTCAVIDTDGDVICRQCHHRFTHFQGLISHMQSTGHGGGACICDECGRIK